MSNIKLSGWINFRVNSQEALPKWHQIALKNALENPPEALRFECRIAKDDRDNLAHIDLPDGESLSLHHRVMPQFGKNSNGHAYLTATMIYSGDGLAYRIKWVGDSVPVSMQRVAVKHDMGLKVKEANIRLDLSKATVTPSYKINNGKRPSERDYKAEQSARLERNRNPVKRATKNCARLKENDIKIK